MIIGMTTKAGADYAGVSESYFKKLRGLGIGPEYIKLSPRCVRYRQEDLDIWMEQHKRRNTITAPKRAVVTIENYAAGI
jgi:predicted DNA-binding transcriptional regulator AlpA